MRKDDERMDIYIRNQAYTGPVKAVVLDWAGTAVDYGCIGPVAVFMNVFQKFGVDVTTEETRKFMGLMKKDHIRCMSNLPAVQAQWEEKYGRLPGEEDVEAMYRETEPMMVSTVSQHADLIPGLLDAVKRFRSMGLRIGSSTGYTRPIMAQLIAAAEKKGYRPDAIVCSTDVPAGRPFPFMCYRNAIDLSVYPLEAMVKIGDTISDIQEGLNAGMWTIGITKTGNEMGLTEQEVNSLSPEDLKSRIQSIADAYRNAGAHYIVEGIWECPAIIEDINNRLSRGEGPFGK